nr:glycosyltransferase [Butyrivibrio sp.]
MDNLRELNLCKLNIENPLLSITLLVSDRKEVEKTLESLTNLRRRVKSELIVVDTGCSEAVLDIIKRYTDKIYKFKWINDFAAARNECVKYATGKWILYLDDDEWFEDTAEIEDFFLLGTYKRYCVCKYIQRNYHDMTGLRYSDDYVSRMAKLSPVMHFEGCIHEYMIVEDTTTAIVNSYVHHYGYVYKSEEDKYKHSVRNLTLLNKMIEKEPDNYSWWFHAAQEYWSLKEYDKLNEISRNALHRFEKKSDDNFNVILASFYMFIIEGFFNTYKFEEAIQEGKRALED